jgi:cell division transport system permease protein
MRQDPWLQGVAVSSLGVALAIMGAYLTLCLNLGQAAEGLASGAAVMAVLGEEVSEQRGRELARELASRPQVERAAYVGRRQALERFRRQLGDRRGLLEGLRENPLPAAVELTLRPAAPAEGLTAELAGLAGVAEVVTSRPWLHRLEEAVEVLGEAAAALGLLLFAGVVFLVANTVRLAVYVRREALEIMDLVGASNGYLRRPFLVETALQALAAAVLASGAVWLLLHLFRRPAALPLGLDAAQLLAFPPVVPPALAAVALAAGLLGGWLGVARALRPEVE